MLERGNTNPTVTDYQRRFSRPGENDSVLVFPNVGFTTARQECILKKLKHL